MNWMVSLPAILTMIGVGLLTSVGLESLDTLLQRGLRRRLTLAVKRVTRTTSTTNTLPNEAAVYGLPENLTLWLLASAAGGLLLSTLAVQGPARVLGLAGGLVPLLWRRQRLTEARRQTRRQVADLIEDMRLRLAFSGTLGSVLYALANDTERPGVVYDRLRLHRDRLALENPEDVIQQLAAELRSPELKRLLARVRASRLGGLSYAEALQAAAAEVVAEIIRQIEVDVEAAPLRLLFPMLILLLPPILALALYPPASVLLNSLTGAGPNLPLR
jgi:hypothetical protein